VSEGFEAIKKALVCTRALFVVCAIVDWLFWPADMPEFNIFFGFLFFTQSCASDYLIRGGRMFETLPRYEDLEITSLITRSYLFFVPSISPDMNLRPLNLTAFAKSAY